MHPPKLTRERAANIAPKWRRKTGGKSPPRQRLEEGLKHLNCGGSAAEIKTRSMVKESRTVAVFGTRKVDPRMLRLSERRWSRWDPP